MKTLISLFVSTFISISISAQTVSGKLVDEQNQPLPYANVVLLSLPDSTFVTGTVSAEDGTFSLATTAEKQLVRISSIGYNTLYRPTQPVSMGVIQMTTDTQILGEVVVKGNLPKTRIKDDALVTTIQNSPLAHAGTANDVLGRVPGVIKNGESIEVLGKGSPIIYINGRQMRNASELDQLSSASIKDVEVITTPGAQYDASVNSVIRIKTVKPVGEGFGFNSRTVLGVAHYIYGLEELNFNYRKNGFDLFGMLEYDNNRDRQNNTMVDASISHSCMLVSWV